MESEKTKALLSEWLDGWRRRDATALAAAFSESATYDSMLAGHIHGHAEIECLYRSWFSAFPDMEFELESQLTEGAQAAVFWSQRGRHLGDFCGLSGTGRSYVLKGAFLITFRDERIISMHSIYDFTGLLVQIGVLKTKPA